MLRKGYGGLYKAPTQEMDDGDDGDGHLIPSKVIC